MHRSHLLSSHLLVHADLSASRYICVYTLGNPCDKYTINLRLSANMHACHIAGFIWAICACSGAWWFGVYRAYFPLQQYQFDTRYPSIESWTLSTRCLYYVSMHGIHVVQTAKLTSANLIYLRECTVFNDLTRTPTTKYEHYHLSRLPSWWAFPNFASMESRDEREYLFQSHSLPFPMANSHSHSHSQSQI